MTSNTYFRRSSTITAPPALFPPVDTSKDQELAKLLQDEEDKRLRRSSSFSKLLPRPPSAYSLQPPSTRTKSPTDYVSEDAATSRRSKNNEATSSHEDSVIILDSDDSPVKESKRTNSSTRTMSRLYRSAQKERQDTSKDEEMARKLQEELDKELANSLLQNSIEHQQRAVLHRYDGGGDAEELMDYEESTIGDRRTGYSQLTLDDLSRRHRLPPIARTSSAATARRPTATASSSSTLSSTSLSRPASSSSSSSSRGSTVSSRSTSSRGIPYAIQNDMMYEVARSNSASHLNPVSRVNVTSNQSSRNTAYARPRRIETPPRAGHGTEHELTNVLSFLQNRPTSTDYRSRDVTGTTTITNPDASEFRPIRSSTSSTSLLGLRSSLDQSRRLVENNLVRDWMMSPETDDLFRSRTNGHRTQTYFPVSHNRDFNSNDYESLLRLDELHCVVKKLSSSEIQALPIFEFKSSNEASSDNTCSVCFEDYKLKETLVALACSHKFHKKCITQWLKQNRSCPLCKKDAVTGE